MPREGLFITFEGLEGVGKSTSIELAETHLRERGIACLRTREPGGTPVAEHLREVVLGHHNESLDDLTELLLMFAARRQNTLHTIRPALAEGRWVLCDRFTDATLAYQGYGRGLPLERIRTLARWVHDDLLPDATVLLEAPAAIANERMAGRGTESDRIEVEAAAFFARAGRGYSALADAEPNRFHRVDAGAPLESVADQIAAVLMNLEKGWHAS